MSGPITWENFPWGYLVGLLVALLITLWLTRDR